MLAPEATSNVVADEEAGERGEGADAGGEHEHHGEAVGQEAGDDGRDDKRGGDERDAEDANRGDDRGREDEGEEGIDKAGAHAVDRRNFGVEREEEELLVEEEDHDDREGEDAGDDQEVRFRGQPRRLPNRAASKFRVMLRARLMRATPKAKLAVVMMPIAASAPI